jgi:hypothetical protein
MDFEYDPLDLVCITESFFKYMDVVNRKGFVPHNYLNSIFVILISKHLTSLGYEDKMLANSELTYTM